jgi:hypothetical protein
VSLPPSAIGAVKKYFLSLASRGVPYSAVVTRFSLVPDKSSGGISYSLAQLSMVEKLGLACGVVVADADNVVNFKFGNHTYLPF